MIRVFISHAEEDGALAESLIDLLHVALNLRTNEIRCTSVDGYRFRGGDDFDERIRAEVTSSTVFLVIVSKPSSESPYVLFEVGARWGAKALLIPLLSPGTASESLSGPLAGFNALRADNRRQLQQLVRELADTLGAPLGPADAYDRHIDRILRVSARSQVAVAPNAQTGAQTPVAQTKPSFGGAVLDAIASVRVPQFEIPKHISLKWKEYDAGLDVEVTSTWAEVIRNFSLFVVNLKRRSSSGKFVDVPEYHENGPFQEVKLHGSSSLYCESPDRRLFVKVTPGGGLQFGGTTASNPSYQLAFHTGGIWEVSLRHESAVHQHGSDKLHFEWTPGNLPVPWQPPSSAPSITALRNRNRNRPLPNGGRLFPTPAPPSESPFRSDGSTSCDISDHGTGVCQHAASSGTTCRRIFCSRAWVQVEVH
jgi:hypothetical protein